MDMQQSAEYISIKDQILRLKLEEPYNFDKIRYLQQKLDRFVKIKMKTIFCVQNPKY